MNTKNGNPGGRCGCDDSQMAKDGKATKVRFKMRGKECIAVFPDLEWCRGQLTAYAHDGQHFGCDAAIVRNSRDATEAEYADLKKELVTVARYTNLVVANG